MVDRVSRLPIDSDLTPFTFMRAHDRLVTLLGKPWWPLSTVLVVSREEDLGVVGLIQEIIHHEHKTVFADIPEFGWILFADEKAAVYSVGA